MCERIAQHRSTRTYAEAVRRETNDLMERQGSRIPSHLALDQTQHPLAMD
jgi:hypothetical protein